jgi:hypothetical protein
MGASDIVYDFEINGFNWMRQKNGKAARKTIGTKRI